MDEARPELVRAKRDRIRQLYGSLFDRVSEILFRHDPVGINFGTNTDEYEAEAGTILPRLEDVRSEEETLDAVYEEFVGWFDPAIAGPRGNYEDVAGEVWAGWREYKTVRGGR